MFSPHSTWEAQFASLAVLHRSAVIGWFTSHGRKLKWLACSLAASPAFVALSRLVYAPSAHWASAVLPIRLAM